MRLSIIGFGIVLLTAGCAMRPELTPAPAANLVAGVEDAAVAEVAGVRTVVRANAWTGVPAALPELTPLQASIENRSGRPLRIQYHQFVLVSPSARRYAARSRPIKEDTAVTSGPIMPPGFPYRGFSFAPYYNPRPLTLPGCPGPFPYDPVYGSHYYGLWRAPLPNEYMREKALPEGILAEDGYLFRHPGAERSLLPRIDGAEQGDHTIVYGGVDLIGIGRRVGLEGRANVLEDLRIWSHCRDGNPVDDRTHAFDPRGDFTGSLPGQQTVDPSGEGDDALPGTDIDQVRGDAAIIT